MIVSDARFASEIVAPDEEPRFVDDLGCLANYLSEHPLAADAIVYVADHRTKAWVRASEATYTRAATVTAPMGSHIVAHVSAASRDADTEVRKGDPVDPANALTRPGGSR